MTYRRYRHGERGNVLFIILLAVALIGALTAALQSSSRPEGAHIDNETLLIRATEVQRYASELERAILYIRNNGVSESDIRFAFGNSETTYGNLAAGVSDNSNEVFHPNGGGAKYRLPPKNISNGDDWEFYGGSALQQVGSDRTELLAVLPNVTQQFCEQINSIQGLTGQPLDTGATASGGTNAGSCLHGGAAVRFGNARTFYDSLTPNTDFSGFSSLPARQGCVQCNGGAYHFYHVLLAR